MRILKLIGSMIILAGRLSSQNDNLLTIDQCYQLARQNYPLIKQMALIEKTKEYNIANASKGYLPQLNILGQATYQSEVTQIPISLPGVNVPQISKDQYKIYGEVSQSLTDPLIIKQQKELIKTNSASDAEKLEVEMFKLKERINQIYFGILLIDAQLQQTELLKNDIQSGLTKTGAAIANGTAFRSSADLLNAELLKAEQRTIELKANRKGFADMLSILINQTLTEAVVLQEPPVQSISSGINRPELKLYDVQTKSFEIQNKILLAKNLPRLNLFFQGGYGRPTLNLLNNDFDTYYIAGVRFSWNITGFYTFKNEKRMQGINQNVINIQKEIFLFNTNLSLKQQSSEVSKLSELVLSDNQIISLREKVKTTSSEQLANGMITPIDYLSYVNAYDQAKQNQALHKIQLLMAQYNYQTTSGN